MAMSKQAITIKTNASTVAKNLNKKILKLQKSGGKTVKEVAEFGKSYAQKIAPAETGATIRAIKWTKGKTPSTATVIFGDGHPERRGKIQGKYGLTYYMNYVGKKSNWTSGNPRFIDTTSAEVRKRFSVGMRRVVNAFVNGK